MTALAEPGINGLEARPPGTLTRERAASKGERERRRALVAEMVARKFTLVAMQEALAAERPGIFVSIQTISNDRQLALRGWQEDSRRSIDHHVTQELADMATIRNANFDGALTGDPVASSAVFGAHDRKSKLLGLAAPARVEVSGPGGAAIEVESREVVQARAIALIERLRATPLPIEVESHVRELTE